MQTVIFALYPAFYGKGAGMSRNARICLNPSLKLAPYLKPSFDSAYRSASLRNRSGRFNRGALDEGGRERLEAPDARINGT